jgi:hypothetical protein
LPIFAEDIVESLGHQFLKAEAMLAAQTCMARDISGEKYAAMALRPVRLFRWAVPDVDDAVMPSSMPVTAG